MMAMATLLHYHTVAGMLLPVNNSVIEAELKKAALSVGEASWRRGFSGFTRGGPTEVVRSHLELVGVKARAVTGALSSIKLATTRDAGGNEYHKVRIGFDAADGNVIVSLDVDSEIAQRLAQKLLNAVTGELLTFMPFSTLVAKDGRVFCNHAVSLKRPDGSEVTAPPNLWAQAQAFANEAEKVLRGMNMTDRTTINRVKDSKKSEFHLSIYRNQLMPRFSVEGGSGNKNESESTSDSNALKGNVTLMTDAGKVT